jgi:hypothetical protein
MAATVAAYRSYRPAAGNAVMPRHVHLPPQLPALWTKPAEQKDKARRKAKVRVSEGGKPDATAEAAHHAGPSAPAAPPVNRGTPIAGSALAVLLDAQEAAQPVDPGPPREDDDKI